MAILKIPTDTSQATLGYLLADGTIVGSTSQAQDFGSTGIKADVVAESTAAAGVTIDSVILKDNEVLADRVFINQARSALSRLAITEDATGGTKFVARITVSPTLNATAAILGLQVIGTTDYNGENSTQTTGIQLAAGIKDTSGAVGTITNWRGLHIAPNVPSAGPNVTTMTLLDIAPTNLGNLAGTTTGYGIRIQDLSGNGGTTYGVRIEDMGTGTTYGFFQDGTNPLNILNANTGIGASTDPNATLDVTGNVIIDGDTDVEQLIVEGHSTQTTKVFVVRDSDTSVDFSVATGGNVFVAAELTMGDLDHNGTKIGFFTIAPVVRAQVGDDIKDALTAYGLLQGTSATPLNLDGGALTSGAITATNITDNASVEVLRLQGDRATFADDDEAFMGLYLSDDGGTQTEFARWTWIAKDVSAGEEDAGIRLDLRLADTLTQAMTIDALNSNVTLGMAAGDSFTTATDSICIGKDAGTDLTSGIRNTFIGTSAGANTTTSNDNLFIGFEAGLTNTTGASGFFMGANAGRLNTSGAQNTFIGVNAGTKNTTGANNVFIGYFSGTENTDKEDSVFIGQKAGTVSTGRRNTFVGSLAGEDNSTGVQNTFIGYSAAKNATTGAGHLVLGGLTAPTLTTGQFMIIVGHESDVSSGGITSSIILGYAATATANNQLVLGSANANGAITDAYIGSGVVKASPAALTLQTTGGSGTDNAGADFNIGGGKPTGSGTGGSLNLQTAPAGLTGTDLQALVTRLTIDSAGNAILNSRDLNRYAYSVA